MPESGIDPNRTEPSVPVAANTADAPSSLTYRDSFAGDAINVLRGFMMGAADTVPGVSGGTVALILGHYQRLVTAISRVDVTLLGLVKQRRLRDAANYIDLRFLFALGAGIAVGILSLAGLMHWLLDHKLPETLAVFLGLVLASVWIVRRFIETWNAKTVIAAILGALVAAVICILPVAQGNMSLPFIFVSASIAICAMILPGISGAFVLLLLGVYHPITGLVKDAARGNFTLDGLIQIAVFCCGCGFGLLAFSRVLRYLLERHRDTTMAALVGLMVGSVGRLWPMQMPSPETANLEAKFRVMEYYSPSEWPGNPLVLVALAIAAGLFVIVIERVAEEKA